MAIKLTDKPNIIAPSSAYPFGRPRDNDGSNNGTPYNEEVHNDYMQFFEKLFDVSGLSQNGLRDNATDGFQTNEALLKWVIGLNEWADIDLTGSNFANVGNPYFAAQTRYNAIRGVLEFRGLLRHADTAPSSPQLVGQIQVGGSNLTFAKEVYLAPTVLNTPLNTGVSNTGGLHIDTTGEMTFPAAAVTANQYLMLDGLYCAVDLNNFTLMP